MESSVNSSYFHHNVRGFACWSTDKYQEENLWLLSWKPFCLDMLSEEVSRAATHVELQLLDLP